MQQLRDNRHRALQDADIEHRRCSTGNARVGLRPRRRAGPGQQPHSKEPPTPRLPDAGKSRGSAQRPRRAALGSTSIVRRPGSVPAQLALMITAMSVHASEYLVRRPGAHGLSVTHQAAVRNLRSAHADT